MVGLKTHSKITLVVRKEEDGIRRYVHLGTGNYNDATAKLYTDIGMMTASEAIGEDATAVFNMLSGYSEPRSWNRLSLAPLWLKDRFLYLIEREKKNAEAGREGHIIAKMNSLCDRDIIVALYEASRAGVRIELIVRGICCLKVGIPGVSENISVRSIVGNFLEHARVFYFENNGNPEFYCSSADWMPRNLERRVEILFPVEAPALKEKLWHILEGQLRDNKKAHILKPDGSYEKVDGRGKEPYCAQEVFCKEAQEMSVKKNIGTHGYSFRKPMWKWSKDMQKSKTFGWYWHPHPRGAGSCFRRSDWNLPLCRAQKKKMQKRRRQVRWCRSCPVRKRWISGSSFLAGRGRILTQIRSKSLRKHRSRILTENGSRSCW